MVAKVEEKKIKEKRTLKTTKYQIFDYWKDKAVSGGLLKDTPTHVKAMVYDWGEPCCFGCNKWTNKEIHDKDCGTYRKLWGHRSVRLERAHIIPHALGGSDSPDNIVLLCKECHLESPDTKYPEMFFLWLAEKRDNDYLKMQIDCLQKATDTLGELGYSVEQIQLGVERLLDDSLNIVNTHGTQIVLSTYTAAIIGATIEANTAEKPTSKDKVKEAA